MKKWFIWSYERGSFQYDVLCGLILVTMILIPSRAFNDRPEYMRLSEPDSIRRVLDDDGNRVYTVQLERSFWFPGATEQRQAEDRLRAFLEDQGEVEIYQSEKIYDNWSAVAAYAFWVR